MKRFESGAHKRRKIEREKNLIDKTRKVSSFFHVVPSQSEIERRPCNSPSSTEPQNHLLIDNNDPAIEVSQFSSSTFSEQGGQIVCNLERESLVSQHIQEEFSHNNHSKQNTHEMNTHSTQNDKGEQIEVEEFLSLDIALWDLNRISKTQLQEYFIRKGPSCYQNLDSDFSKSIRVYEFLEKGKQVSQKRSCQLTFFYKELQNGEKVKRDWLLYSPSTGKIYCFVCKLFGSTLMPTNPFNSNGFNDWKHGAQAVSFHENSQQHRASLLSFLNRSSMSGRIDSEIQKQVNEERDYWRQILTRIVSVVKFLTGRGLALRGDVEEFGCKNNGNYLGLLELISEYDPILKEHIKKYGGAGSGTTSYLSPSTCDEFIHIMGKRVLQEIIKEVKASRYYSISVDSTPDVAHIDQLTFIIRYVLFGEPTERFLKFLPISGHSAENLFDEVVNFLNEITIPISHCRGQSYDNASNMSGCYNGLQAKVKELNELAQFIPCSGHSLNLVGVSAAEGIPEAARFFYFVQSLYVFFSSSTSRWRILLDSLTGKKKVVKALSTTRWSARADAVTALYDNYAEIKSALQKIEDDDDQTAETKVKASSSIASMQKFEIAFLTLVWNDILTRINKVNKVLQKPTLTLSTTVTILNSLSEYINKKRDSFEMYFTKTEKFIGSTLSTFEQCTKETRVSKRNSRIKFFDNSQTPDTVFTPKENLKIKVFLPIIDKLVNNLKDRASKYYVIAERFGFLENLVVLSESSLKTPCNTFSRIYKNDVCEKELFEECLHLQGFLKEHVDLEKLLLKTEDDDKEKDEEKDDKDELDNHDEEETIKDDVHDSGASFISKKLNLKKTYKYLYDNGLLSVFPNIEICLRIFLCLMVSNASAERSFSKLKLVKNYLRNSIKQERLNALSILSIENDIMSKISFDEIIDDFAERKCRKKMF